MCWASNHQNKYRNGPRAHFPFTKTLGKERLVMMTRKGDLKELSEPNAMLFVLLYKDILLSTNNLPSTLPSIVFDALQEYEDVFPNEVPQGLPPKRGIEHQIYLVSALPSQIVLPTTPTQKKQRRFSNKWKN
jgi:hypothetical protein